MDAERWQEVKRVFDAALSMRAPERRAYLERLAATDAELSAEAASLLSAHEQNPEFLESPYTPAAAAAAPAADPHSWEGRTLGAYRIVALVGEGGMGAVYRGVRADGLYDRPVAVKAIRSGLSTEFFLSRFENERRILARLDHPNIARLLDGGATGEGVPYVVMEFVDGTPIDEYCAREHLPVRRRLELFRSVCAAVQYAHQNLIVHRDLKPANILVTADGQPKLLDFGIAKIRDPGQESGDRTAQTAMPMMTPEFASPEQARGEAVTTASDVYSLGVILYMLLSGERPYRFASRAAHDLVRAICDTEPARPSAVAHIETATRAERSPADERRERQRVRRLLRGDLDNIVLMALRKEASRRYQSAEQFGSDIDRYLASQPVAASRDTLRYRSAKLLIRHRAGVGAAGVVLAALLVGLAMTWREAHIAQQRFDDVRSLANSLIFDIHDAIQDLPGSTAARKLVIERALVYLDKMASEARGDASLQREVASGYQRIGDVQGNVLTANLGDTGGSLLSYRKALALRETLSAAHPQYAADAAALAKSLRLVAHAETLSGATAEAWKHSQLAVSAGERAASIQPRDAEVLKELREDYAAEAWILGGNTNLSNLGDTTGALAARQRELDVARRIRVLEPDSPKSADLLAHSVAHLGDQLALVGQRRASLEQYLEAERMFEDLAQQSPGPNASFALQSVGIRVYFARYSMGDKSGALASAQRSVEIVRTLTSADPKDFRARMGLMIDLEDLAVVQSGLGNMAEARAAISEAEAEAAKLLASNPSNGELPSARAGVYLTAGDIRAKLGDYPRALAYEREAVDILARVQAEDADNVDARIDLADAYNSLGRLLSQTGDVAAAAALFDQALALSKPQTAAPHPSEESLYSVAESYAALGGAEERSAARAQAVEERREHLERARDWYRQSLEQWSRIREPAMMSPGGYECVQPSVVKERLDAVSAALGTMSAALGAASS